MFFSEMFIFYRKRRLNYGISSIEVKNKMYRTVGTALISNRNMTEAEATYTLLTHIHDHSYSCLR
jgi:hypothetical protein